MTRRRKIGRNRAHPPTATQPTDNATQPTPTRKGSSFRGKGLNLGFDMPDMPMKRPAAIAWACWLLGLFIYDWVGPLANLLIWSATGFLIWRGIVRFMSGRNKLFHLVIGFLVCFFAVALFLLLRESAEIYAGWFIKMNSQGETLNFHNLGAGFFENGGIIGWFISKLLKGIAGSLNDLRLTTLGLLGLCILIIVQFFQVLRLIIKECPPLTEWLEASMGQYNYISMNGKSMAQRGLAKDHNSYDNRFMRNLLYLQIAAFAIDIFICSTQAELFNGGWSVWSLLFGTGAEQGQWDTIRFAGFWAEVNWPEVRRVFVTVTMFYGLTWLFLMIWQSISRVIGGKQKVQQSNNQTQTA